MRPVQLRLAVSDAKLECMEPNGRPRRRHVRAARHAKVVALALSAWCAGCMVGPDFQRPPLPSASSLTELALPAQTVATPVPGGEAQVFEPEAPMPSHWWSLYGSAALDQLVDLALHDSPTVAAAQAALRQAQETLAAQRAGLLPSLTGVANGTREKISGAAEGIPQAGTFLFNLFNTSVNLSYNLDIFGGVRRGIEAQEAARDVQRGQMLATYQMLVANVVTAAVLEASSRAQLDATVELLASARRQRDLSQQQFELGGAARSDVLAAESNLASLEATLPALQQQLAAVRSQLAVYVGRPPADYRVAPLVLEALQLPHQIPVSVPAQLVRRRPDVLVAEAQLHEASAVVGVATANLLPQISISGSFGDTSTALASLLRSNAFALGAGVTQPLFEGGALTARRRAAIAAYDQALAQYRQTVLLACKNASDALRALDNDAQALSAQFRAQSAAAESLHLVEQRYGFGGSSNLELLTAQQQFQRSRLGYVQALAARYADTAALFLALGGDWDLSGSTAAANLTAPGRPQPVVDRSDR
jgi:NodT family efflux transporter outer membrane factor (OMF) lipoprotein